MRVEMSQRKQGTMILQHEPKLATVEERLLEHASFLLAESEPTTCSSHLILPRSLSKTSWKNKHSLPGCRSYTPDHNVPSWKVTLDWYAVTYLKSYMQFCEVLGVTIARSSDCQSPGEDCSTHLRSLVCSRVRSSMTGRLGKYRCWFLVYLETSLKYQKKKIIFHQGFKLKRVKQLPIFHPNLYYWPTSGARGCLQLRHF